MLSPNRFVAVLLLACALAACSDAPTGAAITAADQPAAFNTAPTVTVTNSGGTPLISWGALAGATSYTVTYRELKITFVGTQGSTQEHLEPLVTTSGTSYLDTLRTYTGDFACVSYGTNSSVRTLYQYLVTANYPTGTATTFAPAPVSPC